MEEIREEKVPRESHRNKGRNMLLALQNGGRKLQKKNGRQRRRKENDMKMERYNLVKYYRVPLQIYILPLECPTPLSGVAASVILYKFVGSPGNVIKEL